MLFGGEIAYLLERVEVGEKEEVRDKCQRQRKHCYPENYVIRSIARRVGAKR